MSTPVSPDDAVAQLVSELVGQLEDAGVRLDRPLSEADVKRVEKKYAFTFPVELRALLRTALPSGDAWLNWRHATPAKVRERLGTPLAAAVTSARRAWPPAWGSLPGDDELPATVAARLTAAPTLIPLYAADYLPESGGPVIRAGADGLTICAETLPAYLRAFDAPTPPVTAAAPVPVWSDLLP